jgi:hypothetical protein
VQFGEGTFHGRRLCNGCLKELFIDIRNIFYTVCLRQVGHFHLFIV